MAFTNLAIFGGAFFTPIVVGKITAAMGWKWSFYFVSIFMAATLPAVFLLCPETAYRRDVKLNTDTNAEGEEEIKLQSRIATVSNPPSDEEEAPKTRTGFVLFPTSGALQPIGNARTPKKSFVESLSLFDGAKTDESYWKLLLRPFPLIFNPAFVWGCLIQGTMIGWTIFIGVLVAAIFLGPPYFWGEVKAGYAYTGAFVGALCGFAICGLLADSSVKYLTRKNRGVYEPEFRILLVIPMFIIGGIGLFGFALTAGNVISGQYSYIVPLVFFGFEVAGMVIGAVASSLYIVDAYSKIISFAMISHTLSFQSFFVIQSAYTRCRRSYDRRLHLDDYLQKYLQFHPHFLCLQLAHQGRHPAHNDCHFHCSGRRMRS